MQRNVVEHQGEQGLVGAPLHLEGRGQQAPQAAAQSARHQHDQQQHPVVPVGEVQSEIAGEHRAHDQLALAADVQNFILKASVTPSAQMHRGMANFTVD